MIDADELTGRVRAYAADRTPALDGGAAVLAVSGGADSIATAALLCEAGIVRADVSVVAHFDHGLRGDEAAAADRAAVDELRARYGLALETAVWQAPVPGEAQARDARYGFLAGVARGRRIEAVVTGHTVDDQEETVVLQSLRGAGLHGLRGIASQRSLHGALLARPMLCVSRAETRAYCEVRGLSYLDDATNESRAFLRNRVRLDLLPAMESAAPGARAALRRLADDAREGAAAIDAVAAAALAATTVRRGERWLRLSRAGVRAMSPAVQPYAWRLAITELLGDTREFDRRHYAALARAADAATGATFELARGVRMTIDAEAIVISLGSIVVPAIANDSAWPLPFAGEIGAWRISVTRDSGGATPQAERIALPEGAVVRGRRPGDRIQPRGMRGHKKLQDYYVDRKVPRRERDAAPLIALGRDVLWTPVGIAEPADAGAACLVTAERIARA